MKIHSLMKESGQKMVRMPMIGRTNQIKKARISSSRNAGDPRADTGQGSVMLVGNTASGGGVPCLRGGTMTDQLRLHEMDGPSSDLCSQRINNLN